MTTETESDDEEGPIKVVVVGDGGIGKICLLICFSRNEFPTEYVPTVFDNLYKEVTILQNGNERTVMLDLWDTAGQEEFDRIRPLSYRGCDIFLVCFCVTEHSSFDNLSYKWLPEIRHHRKEGEYQILLVGLKCDLRKNNSLKAVKLDEIEEYRKKINAVGYVECSSLTRENVPEVFETAILAHLDFDKTVSKKSVSKKSIVNKNTNENQSQNCVSLLLKNIEYLSDY